jgi:PEP-CTERM motif-containing protein
MKFAFKSIVVAAALVAAGAASADTLAVGGTVSNGTYDLSALSGTGTLSFSSTLIGALNAGGVQVAQVDPAVVTSTKRTNGKYASVSAAAPVTALDFTSTGTNSITVNGVSTAGGALQTAEADDFTTTGGSLAITNLRVDLGASRVYADLDGANGVGFLSNVYLWDITTITGPTSFSIPAGSGPQTVVSNNELTGLKINTAAFNLFSQSLGLTSAGNDALATVTDFGKIVSTISVTATPAVPEPSSYALALAGLAGVGMLARRRRAQ